MSKSIQSKVFRVAQRTLKPLIRRSYGLARSFGVYGLRIADVECHPPLVIYQMGKVGSTSILQSLRASALDIPIYHVHCLTDDGLNYVESVYRSEFAARRFIPRHLFASLYLRQRMTQSDWGKKWKVITLVRDPVAQDMSSFFQLIRIQSAGPRQWHLKSVADNFEIRLDVGHIEQLIAIFFDRPQRDRSLNYFDHEFGKVFDFDVFETDFPRTQGYHIYDTPNADILLLRLEDLKQCAEEAVQAFMQIDGFDLVSQNVGDEKEYGELYTAFKNAIRFPEDYLDKMYSSKLARHFYSDVELGVFRRKWSEHR